MHERYHTAEVAREATQDLLGAVVGTASVAVRCSAFWKQLCVEGGCFAPGRLPYKLPAVAKGLEGLRRDLLFSAWLSSGLRPINLLFGLRYYIYSVSTLQALQIFSVHVPVSIDVSPTPGTCLEIYHRT